MPKIPRVLFVGDVHCHKVVASLNDEAAINVVANESKLPLTRKGWLLQSRNDWKRSHGLCCLPIIVVLIPKSQVLGRPQSLLLVAVSGSFLLSADAASAVH
jgi:hypothetical protein